MYAERRFPLVATYGPPLHRILLPFAFGATAGGLLTDIVYIRSMDMQWSNFAAWLITAGAIVLVVCVLVGLFDLVTHRLSYSGTLKWPYAALLVVGLIIAIFNTMVHTHDAWTSVMPWGITLSVIGTLVLLAAGLVGWPHLPTREREDRT